MLNQKLSEHFIKNSPNFFDDTKLHNVDEKHKKILASAYKEINKKKAFNKTNFRDWEYQSDLAVPMQLSSNAFQNKNWIFVLFKYMYKKIFSYNEEKNALMSLLDDIDIIKKIGGERIIKENPVNQTPGVNIHFFANGYNVNSRWLRYLYIAQRILSMHYLPSNGIWVDIGSYYGGLQGIIRKYIPDSKIIMVDFHHQLCRSFIYLSNLYPEAIHILPNKISSYNKLNEIPKGSFIYVPISNYNLIADQKVDLASNFYSFGEMKREFFLKYFESDIFTKASNVYLVNRWISSPFFEKTFDSNLSFIDYFNKDRSIKYLDIFPMSHYFPIKRKLFGRVHSRNISSSYFELVSSNVKKKTY